MFQTIVMRKRLYLVMKKNMRSTIDIINISKKIFIFFVVVLLFDFTDKNFFYKYFML